MAASAVHGTSPVGFEFSFSFASLQGKLHSMLPTALCWYAVMVAVQLHPSSETLGHTAFLGKVPSIPDMLAALGFMPACQGFPRGHSET